MSEELPEIPAPQEIKGSVVAMEQPKYEEHFLVPPEDHLEESKQPSPYHHKTIAAKVKAETAQVVPFFTSNKVGICEYREEDLM